MAKQVVQYVTPSGVAIPEDDYQAIRRDATKDSVRNGLALIGAGALILGAKAFSDWYRDRNNTQDD